MGITFTLKVFVLYACCLYIHVYDPTYGSVDLGLKARVVALPETLLPNLVAELGLITPALWHARYLAPGMPCAARRAPPPKVTTGCVTSFWA